MPDRVRKIGPQVSREVIGHILLRRLELGWGRPRMCEEMRARGYEMTERTLQNIETGVITPGRPGRQVRLVTVDELTAFAETLLLTEEELRTGNWSDDDSRETPQAPSLQAVDPADLRTDVSWNPAGNCPDVDPSSPSASS